MRLVEVSQRDRGELSLRNSGLGKRIGRREWARFGFFNPDF
jgi:hypothetical protein